ncbi:carbonic anhydrase [Iodobacter fluviatilis]|uniref:carbonic anhydrase n=1 Tax=Iodobacter fluviatilis TaxID=537 RepID=A0A377Q7K9_9NEIS|nr:carbonic anhydrase family protein [Iodobacter fluviatilis]TCU88683.1 carbonic anhydrase [Iodobacter fluviatilis]STQ91246.1 Carbonic anhydrase precursor [Iodobacter fluviatilis]
MRYSALMMCLTVAFTFAAEPSHKAATPEPAHKTEKPAAETVAPSHDAPPETIPVPHSAPVGKYGIPSPGASHRSNSNSHAAKKHSAPSAHAPAAAHGGRHGAPHAGGHWGYEDGSTGPNSWGSMSPSFALCAEGKEQSPINITTSYAQEMEKIKFNYGMTRIIAVNNGHTIQLNIDPGSYIEALGSKYQLLQFHFHTPSEEAIGGIRYPMVAHLVHKSEEGKLAVVAALIQQGAQDNPLIEALWDKMPDEHNESRTFDKLTYSPAALLPLDQSFYTFMGSLTTPPCSEGVRWLVMKNPLSISAKQIARFRKLFPMNARPIQSINARNVMEGM